MAQSVAVVRRTLTATLSGTTDFTSSGFGTPSAAIVIMCRAGSGFNPIENSETGISVGFWDGTNQRCVAISANDGLSTTEASRKTFTDRIAAQINSDYLDSTDSASFSCSAVTDGIRLTMSNDNTGVQHFCTVVLIKGVSASAFTLTPNSTQDGTQASPSLGFEPGIVFFASTGDVSGGRSPSAVISLGIDSSSLIRRCVSFTATNGVSTSDQHMLLSESRSAAQITSSVNWGLEVTTWGSDGFTATTRDGGSGGDDVYCLALGGADLSAVIGTVTTPASTGNNDIATTGIDPEAVMIAMTSSPGTSVISDGDAEGLCFGLADGSGQFSHTWNSDDGVSTSNVRASASDSKIMDLDLGGGSALADATASLGTEKFTLNYSAVPATARKGFFVAFGPATGGGGFQPAWAMGATQVAGVAV